MRTPLLTGASLLLAAACATARAQTPAPPPPASPDTTAPVSAVGCVGMTVSDLDRSVDFYSHVLSFTNDGPTREVAGDAYEKLEGVFALRMRVARLKLGRECIELTEYLAPRGRPIPVDAKSNDRAFQHVAIVVRDMAAAYDVLRANKVEHASSGPQTLPLSNPNAGGIKAFYFKDPDRHVLEVIWFPRGKGDPRWQNAPGSGTFLGIDHTAIVVGDTDTSVAYYRALGLRIAGTSENEGVEQEHLNAVFGAHLRITALRAAGGPGIELLEYLAPRDGRPIPSDERANDIAHWQTSLVASDLPSAARAARAPALVTLPDAKLGFTRGVLVRDPDGHVMQLVDRGGTP